MSIICKICNTEFQKIIPWQHLKTHNINSNDYKQKYGNLYSDDTLKKFSSRIPYNKGIKITDALKLEKIKQTIEKREERYRNGELTKRGGKKWSDEEKNNLSIKIKNYAIDHKDDIKDRAKKAINTKKLKNFDFGSPMRGKKHTSETKEKLKKILKLANTNKQINSYNKILSNIELSNLTLLSDISEINLSLKCNNCKHIFNFSKQYFNCIDKIKKEICTKCYPRNIQKSKLEIEIGNFIKNNIPNTILSYREQYHSKEIDIFIPDINIGIEFNGLYWHSENTLQYNNKPYNADFLKRKYFKDKGIRLIQIFEDEYKEKKDIVESRLLNIIGKCKEKIYARNCVIKEVPSNVAALFCEENHIMGAGRSNIRYGLYNNDNLVCLMTFSSNNLSRKIKKWEINRFVSIKNINVVGGASKLFKHFIKNLNPEEVISYSDNRWSDGSLYKMLGFSKISDGTPNYWYFFPNELKRIHRFTLRKNKFDNQNLTEYENRLNQGYLRIWDCGSSKWVWKK